MTETIVLTALIFLAALLYSSVGHAGASGYLAAMALFQIAPDKMKPTALVLNIVVATVGTIRFARAGYFAWNLFWPFAVASIPLAFLGGKLSLPVPGYKIVVGCVLFFAAWRLAFRQSAHAPAEQRPIPLGAALLFGAAIGFLSGLVGVGGGIFLSPLLLFLGWADPKRTAGVSVVFILVNSVAGLLGNLRSLQLVQHEILWWSPAVLLGGIIGSGLGSRRLAPMMMRRLLAAVLLIAGADQIWRGAKILLAD